jgi:hydrogenase maturation protease
MNDPRILIAGVGNIFLGDDAFGVVVVRQLSERQQPTGVRIVDFGIRGLDLTYALLERYEAVIIVDAVSRGGPAGTLYVLELEPEKPGAAGVVVGGHNLDPASVLRLAAEMGSTIQRLYVVGCEPRSLHEYDDMSDGLSGPVRAAVSEAILLIETLVADLLARFDPDSILNRKTGVAHA